MLSACTKLRDEQFIAAAEAVARMVTREDLARGAMFPPLNNIREVRQPVNAYGSAHAQEDLLEGLCGVCQVHEGSLHCLLLLAAALLLFWLER